MKVLDKLHVQNSTVHKYFHSLFRMFRYESSNKTKIIRNELYSANRACKWNRKRPPFMSVKLSTGDIMATEMHTNDAYTMTQL